MNLTFILPGTVIETKQNTCRQIISSLFETGGLVLSQVCIITGLETHMVQNWVKRGFVSSPVDKKYTEKQFCRIMIINVLKEVLPLHVITKLLSHINGRLDDESDDLIDDSELYFYFTDLVFKTENDVLAIDHNISRVLKNYEGESWDAKLRLEKVLRIMITAYLSAELKKKALLCFANLDDMERSD